MTFRSLLRAGATASTVGLFWLTGSVPASYSQVEVTPSPSASPKAKYGYVRFWNLLPDSVGRLEFSVPGDKEGKASVFAGPGTFPPSYRTMLPARYTWIAARPGEAQKPLKTLANVAVNSDVYVTILARPSDTMGGEPIIEVLNDTPDPSLPASNELRVYQISPDIKAVITANRTLKSDPLSYGATQVIRDLPKAAVPLTISITTKTGTGNWNTEADFRQNSHATLVVLADVYGRIRPRVTSDGPPRSSEVSAGSSTAPPTTSTPPPTTR